MDETSQLNPLMDNSYYTPSGDLRSTNFLDHWVTPTVPGVEVADTDTNVTDEDIDLEFSNLLDRHKVSNVIAVSHSGHSLGTLIKLSDLDETDSVIVMFRVHPDGVPYADIVGTEHDNLLSLDLSAMSPSMTDSGAIDLTNVKWLNKSTLLTILSAGHVGNARDLIKTVMESVAAELLKSSTLTLSESITKVIVRGSSIVKLPILTASSLSKEEHTDILSYLQKNTDWIVPSIDGPDFINTINKGN
jgi:hypothetical protein